MFYQDYVVESGSDDEFMSNSSDDDITEALLGNTVKQVKLQKRQHENGKKDDSDSEDEFEKEMKAELKATVSAMEKERAKGVETTEKAKAADSKEKQKQEFYDEAYFDSDSDEDRSSNDKKNIRHPVLSNDDLLYDPDADDEDQRWVDDQRNRYQTQAVKSGKGKVKRRAATNSDALLDCPACMTTLCLDCQRHEVYHNQYRAMFVQNCKVFTTEILRFPMNQKNSRKKKKARFANSSPDIPERSGCVESVAEEMASEGKYHPVRCEICNTEVGVYDSDEVYHFFNVLASYS